MDLKRKRVFFKDKKIFVSEEFISNEIENNEYIQSFARIGNAQMVETEDEADIIISISNIEGNDKVITFTQFMNKVIRLYRNNFVKK